MTSPTPLIGFGPMIKVQVACQRHGGPTALHISPPLACTLVRTCPMCQGPSSTVTP